MSSASGGRAASPPCRGRAAPTGANAPTSSLPWGLRGGEPRGGSPGRKQRARAGRAIASVGGPGCGSLSRTPSPRTTARRWRCGRRSSDGSPPSALPAAGNCASPSGCHSGRDVPVAAAQRPGLSHHGSRRPPRRRSRATAPIGSLNGYGDEGLRTQQRVVDDHARPRWSGVRLAMMVPSGVRPGDRGRFRSDTPVGALESGHSSWGTRVGAREQDRLVRPSYIVHPAPSFLLLPLGRSRCT